MVKSFTIVNDDIYGANRSCVEASPEYMQILYEIDEQIKFTADFVNLLPGRVFIRVGNCIINLIGIFQSLGLTLCNLRHCCLRYCMADANTLLRKYRDDLFFCLYAAVYHEKELSGHDMESDQSMMERNLLDWVNGDLHDLHLGIVLKHIAGLSSVKEIVDRYGLKARFDAIGDELNDYVHGNGINFYNECFWKGSDTAEPVKRVKGISENLIKITVTFVLLVAICLPHYFMSTDYTDYLETEQNPPDGSQYFVAPFVEQYLKKHLSLIDPGCYRYLQENTTMKFN